MKEVIKIFESIKNTSSINSKKDIIAANKDNELFKECLLFLLDSNIQTGLSTKKINKNVGRTEYSSPNFSELMSYLKLHNTGTDDDIAFVQAFIRHQPEKCHDFYAEFVTKKYKIGCDSKVVNSVIPNLIPTWEVMLGTPIEKAKLKENEWISLSHKLNGCRASFYNGKMMTRQGKEYVGLEHIIEDINKMGFSDWFIDGELLYKNIEGLSDNEAFRIGTGIANSKEEDKYDLKFVVFDMFPSKEFTNGKSIDTYKKRCEYLSELRFKIADTFSENVEVVEIVYQGNDHSEIWNWLDHAEFNDWEGLCLNTDSVYECKRTKSLLKVKKFFDICLRVIAIEEGTGRNKGRLGSLVCKYYDNIVKVGSGFSDEERIKLWNNQDDYIGKLIDIKYKEISKGKNTGLESLQFPVFLGFRAIHDKTIADDED